MEMSSSFEVNQTVHNLHNVCVVYTGVGSLEVACAPHQADGSSSSEAPWLCSVIDHHGSRGSWQYWQYWDQGRCVPSCSSCVTADYLLIYLLPACIMHHY